MKKIEFGQAMTILANVGVIIGIALLLIELDQNRELMTAQIRHEVAQELIDQVSRISDNPELAALLIRDGCDEVVTKCDSVDDLRINLYWSGRFRSWESLHYQYRAGLFDEDEFVATKLGWRSVLVIPGVAEQWRTQRSIYSPEFVAEVNDLLPTQEN